MTTSTLQSASTDMTSMPTPRASLAAYEAGDSVEASSLEGWLTSARLGRVALPGRPDPALTRREAGFAPDEARELLMTLGRHLGLKTLAPMQGDLPSSEDESAFEDAAIRHAYEQLDLVWLQGAMPIAAFVFEPGRTGWEGLRQLADLIALHPKIKTALYVVAMPGARGELLAELHRPAYRLLKKPLPESVMLLDWPRLLTEVSEVGERARYLKPEFLAGIAESAAPDHSASMRRKPAVAGATTETN